MQNARRMATILEPWALSLALIWQELAFKASTTGEFWPNMLFVAIFSLAAGMLARLFLGFLPTSRSNKLAKAMLMALAAVVLSVEYFVYRQFKLFYDLNTVTAGAGDAATGFAGTIVSLVLSPSGILHIALFFAPVVAYAVLGMGEDLAHVQPDVFTARVRLGRDAVVCQLVGLLFVSSIGSFGLTYGDRYNFQSSVTSFGLLTSLRKEIQTAIVGSNVSFIPVSEAAESVSQPPNEAADEETSATKDGPNTSGPETEPKQEQEPEPGAQGAPNASAKTTLRRLAHVFAPATLPIDFEALASTTSGTWADLDRYVASLAPSHQNLMTGRTKGYNLIFISAEAFSAEAIREDTTPTLWRMAHKGIQFTDYYQFDTAGTTGGECGNIFGLLPTEGGSSVKLTATHNNYLTIGSALDREGYNGWAFHNNTYTYYGRDATHNNLGYSNGYMGYGNGMERWVTWQWPQSDLEMVQGTFTNLYGNADQEPFNVYYMSVSGHSNYGPGENAMAIKNWDKVKDLPYSDPVKGYLAANIELDAAMEWIIERLEEKNMVDHTLIVIGADHFPYGLDDDGPLGQLPYTSELYGYDVVTGFQRDHNRLIMWTPAFESEDIVVDSPTSTVDILPTLLNLFGCEWDSRLLPGRDVFSDKPALVFTLGYEWKSELGTYYASGEFVPAEGIGDGDIPDDYVEKTNADVANRINYCRGVLTSDYYAHVFGE